MSFAAAIPADLDPGGAFFAAFPLLQPLPRFRELLREAPPFLRILDPGDMHFTIAWFGLLDPVRIEAAWLTLAAAEFPRPLAVRADRLQLLPPRRHPTVVALGMEGGASEVAAWIAALRGPLAVASGVQPDPRPPFPHLTLARLPRRVSRSQLDELQHWATSVAIPSCDLRLGSPRLFGRSIRHPRPRYVHFDPPGEQAWKSAS